MHCESWIWKCRKSNSERIDNCTPFIMIRSAYWLRVSVQSYKVMFFEIISCQRGGLVNKINWNSFTANRSLAAAYNFEIDEFTGENTTVHYLFGRSAWEYFIARHVFVSAYLRNNARDTRHIITGVMAFPASLHAQLRPRPSTVNIFIYCRYL